MKGNSPEIEAVRLPLGTKGDNGIREDRPPEWTSEGINDRRRKGFSICHCITVDIRWYIIIMSCGGFIITEHTNRENMMQ